MSAADNIPDKKRLSLYYNAFTCNRRLGACWFVAGPTNITSFLGRKIGSTHPTTIAPLSAINQTHIIGTPVIEDRGTQQQYPLRRSVRLAACLTQSTGAESTGSDGLISSRFSWRCVRHGAQVYQNAAQISLIDVVEAESTGVVEGFVHLELLELPILLPRVGYHLREHSSHFSSNNTDTDRSAGFRVSDENQFRG